MKRPLLPPEPDFAQEAVAQVFASYPEPVRTKMLALRSLIVRTAAATHGVCELQETIKWGEPAYITAHSKSGSTVRIGIQKNQARYAVYFNCKTSLVDSFRSMFPHTFHFEGSRALVFDLNDAVPQEELAFCVAMALTYHLNKPAKHHAPR